MQARCPSCGSFLEFKSSLSSYQVCSACQTLVVRKDVDLQAVGKVAALQPDGSLLRVGTQGVYQGKSFEIIGRIQVSIGDPAAPDVIWNEWHASFSNGTNGWIGEAQGEYFVSFQSSSMSVPAPSALHLGQVVTVGKERGVVTSVSQATALSLEGELPFVAEPGYTAIFADVSTPSGLSASIDYSESIPLVFEGYWCSFEELKFRGLRSSDGEELQAPQIREANLKSLKCPSCGAPHELQAGGISQTLVCGFCDTAMDLNQDATFKSVVQFEQSKAKIPAKIPLGSRGIPPGSNTEYTCIGYLSKFCRVDGAIYRWAEYLLYEPSKGYRWLTESNGHWSLLAPLRQVPTKFGSEPVGYPPNTEVKLGATTFKHFQKTTATVEYVAGEFYWRVRVGESSEVSDFVAPPQVLSADCSQSEVNWSLGTYVEGAALWKAFRLSGSPPAPRGIANNQVNPHKAAAQRRWTTYAVALLATFGFLTVRTLTERGKFFDETFNYRDYEPDRVQQKKLQVPAGQHNLAITVIAPSLSQRWADFVVTLVDPKTQEARSGSTSLYHQSGVDDGEAWSESVTRSTIHFAHVPGGEYDLQVEPLSNVVGQDQPEGPGTPKSFPNTLFGYTLQASLSQAHWGYLWMVVLLGLIPPLWSGWRSSSFETSRWSESDHAPASSWSDD